MAFSECSFRVGGIGQKVIIGRRHACLLKSVSRFCSIVGVLEEPQDGSFSHM